MIRTAQFVRDKALRYWMDNQGVKLLDLTKYCAVLAQEFEWAKKLNSQARQSAAERAAFSIKRFFDVLRSSAGSKATPQTSRNCKARKPGKKGYPRFV